MEEHFFKFSVFSRYPEIIHGISNRHYGDMRFGNLSSSEIVKNRQHFIKDLKINHLPIVSNQVHGSRIAIMGQEECGRGFLNKENSIIGCDGLITTEKGVFLMILIADCLPILLYDPVLQITGAIHAGWKGIMSGIVDQAVMKYKNLGCDPENLIIGIGPGICQKHFVIRNDILLDFQRRYPQATLVRNKDGYADLKKIASLQLKAQKIPIQNIEVSPVCTVCDNGNYSSVRKEGSDAPEMAAIIGIKND